MLRLTGGAQNMIAITAVSPGIRGRRPAGKQKGATMTYSRTFSRTRSMLVLAALTAAAAFPALRPAEAIPNYDGIWSVVIITNQGICDPSYRYPVRISNGHLGQCRQRDRHHHRQGRKEWSRDRERGRRRQDCDRDRSSRRGQRRRLLERRQRRLLGRLAGRAPQLNVFSRLRGLQRSDDPASGSPGSQFRHRKWSRSGSCSSGCGDPRQT